jgi:hypothetical protein
MDSDDYPRSFLLDSITNTKKRGQGIMNFFVNLTHHKNSSKWVETTATFTGKFEQAVAYTKYGTKPKNYNRYEIIYMTGDEQRHSWYSFYPVPDPDAESIKGMTMRIRYNKRKPFLFEQTEDQYDSDEF